jgi:hypothetical protein
MALNNREIDLLYRYLGEYAGELINAYDNANGIDYVRLSQMIEFELNEAEAAEMEENIDNALDENVEVDANGNWTYSVFINEVEYIIQNEDQVLLDNVQVGSIQNGEIIFY